MAERKQNFYVEFYFFPNVSNQVFVAPKKILQILFARQQQQPYIIATSFMPPSALKKICFSTEVNVLSIIYKAFNP